MSVQPGPVPGTSVRRRETHWRFVHLADVTHFINSFITANHIYVLHHSLAVYSEEINALHKYKIFFEYFTLIGLWDFFNEKVTVKSTAHKVEIHCAPLWKMTKVRTA